MQLHSSRKIIVIKPDIDMSKQYRSAFVHVLVHVLEISGFHSNRSRVTFLPYDLFCMPTAFASDRRILRNTYQNVVRFWYNGQISDIIEGEILAFTYNKNLDDTTLRLTASGSHRSAMPGGVTESCARW